MPNTTASTNENMERCFFRASAADFKKIPGSPIAYWVSGNISNVFSSATSLGVLAEPRQGLASADNERFLRLWFETSIEKISFNSRSADEAVYSGKKWFPIDKGGEFRKWYGNQTHTINWENDGFELKNFERSVIRNPNYYFKDGVTWTAISSALLSVRHTGIGNIFSNAGMKVFANKPSDLIRICGFLNSNLCKYLVSCLSQTLNFDQGIIARLPLIIDNVPTNIIEKLEDYAKFDWDSYETSWDFATLPLLQSEYRQPTLKDTYNKLREHWQEMTLEMQRLEEENNRIFIDAYGLQDELTPDVPLSEITLSCNPRYRYSDKKSDEELEVLLLADTMKEFISYAVGCMFGRYSIDKAGLILANQGETIKDYLAQIPEPTFQPDAYNVISIMDIGWFPDDIADRFKQFLKITFGEENYAANIAFIEAAIGKDIRNYFLKNFYTDHVSTYKKRPIYWMFSSPKGSFNALIYMHRYRPDTVSIVLNEYLREFRTKLAAKKEHLEKVSISASASQSEKTKALKEIEKTKKVIDELDAYERDTLYPLATRQIEIELDDGVLVNYPKFGTALKKVVGLGS